jgi:cellulose synthase operon protein C
VAGRLPMPAALRGVRALPPACGTLLLACSLLLQGGPIGGARASAALPSATETAPSAALPEACAVLRRHGQRTEAQACFQRLTRSADPYLRAEGDWGLARYDSSNEEFRAAVARDDRNARYRVRWGRLLHERFNDTDAAQLFQEALQRDPNSAGAYLGLALVSAAGFDDKAMEYVGKALQLDPRLVEAHELLANLALENSNVPLARAEAETAMRLTPDALDAMAVEATIELESYRSPDPWLQRILRINPGYGAAYALLAHHLVINRRYAEGVDYYRKAIALEPQLWSARSQLAINLLRLGERDEPRQLLEQCYQAGYRDAATVNTLRLLDSFDKHFIAVRDPHLLLWFDRGEAQLLQPYLEPLATRALATYAATYHMSIDEPVQIEVYPDHEDFAVRTLGLPGLGALGVTFGTVVAMDSPSGRKPGSFNWASTLWHEMDHVFVLTATHNRVPRWFAEGLAVHEQGVAKQTWAVQLTPEVVVAMAARQLLPVAQLDRGFIRPQYPDQVLVSYYQAGRICDYIAQRWGAETLVKMVRLFAEPTSTPEVIRTALGEEPAQFDTQFQAWLYQDVGAIVTQFDSWRERLHHLVQLMDDHQFDQARSEAEALRRLYPQYVADASPYSFLAQIYLSQRNSVAAVAVLLDYQRYGGEDPALLKQLATLQEQGGQGEAAAATLDAVNEIYPVNDEELHLRLGQLWLAQHDSAGAIREFTALLALHPLDQAGAHYHLAQAFLAAHQPKAAEQNVLAALEAAPGFRPAQQLLLQLEAASAEPAPRPR